MSGYVHDMGSWTGVDGLAARVVSPVDASGREGVALTPPVALCLVHERLQRRVWALRGDPSDDAARGRLEVLAGVHEHGEVCVHLGAGVYEWRRMRERAMPLCVVLAFVTTTRSTIDETRT